MSIQVRDIGLAFGSKCVLDHFSCAFDPGTWTHIIGPNGSGKTSLLKAMAGLSPMKYGQIIVDECDLSAMTANERAHRIAYVPQRLEALPSLKVIDFVAQGEFASLTGLSAEEILGYAHQALAELGAHHLENCYLKQLSGGELQICVLASAMVQKSQIILLDEPLTALDLKHVQTLCAALKKMAASGYTIISATHDLAIARIYADQTIVLSEQHCIYHGKEFPDNACLEAAFGVKLCWDEPRVHLLEENPESDETNDLPNDLPKERKDTKLLLLLSAVLGIELLICPWVGAVWSFPWMDDSGWHIFWMLRVPRVLFGAIAGGVLAIVGGVFQSLFQNALTTPYTLGIASGSSFGALLAIQLGIAGFWMLPVSAALGGLLTMAGVLALSQKSRQPWFCLMAGISASMLFSALGLILQALATPMTAQQMMRWQLGGLDIVGYTPFMVLPVIAGAVCLLFRYALPLNLLSVDYDLAYSRGVEVRRVKSCVLMASGLATAMVVSVCGPISFVGLIVPNAVRRLFGADLRHLLPISALIGAIFLVLADTMARGLERWAWLPVGVITAVIGVPLFIYALIKK